MGEMARGGSPRDSELIPMARTQATPFTLTPELRQTSTVVVLGSIMSILDTTIVAVALATLGRDFHVSVTTIQWLLIAFVPTLFLPNHAAARPDDEAATDSPVAGALLE